MKKKPRRRRVSPQESVEGPEVKARPRATGGAAGAAAPRGRRSPHPELTFPTGANRKRRVFKHRKKEKDASQ